MNKKVAISQSNYIPWKGYFDLINSVDEFVFYDDVQFTKRDWRNRNLIKTKDGVKWLTIPIEVKGKFYQKINETKVSDHNWGKSHWESIVHSYSRAEYFNEFQKIVEHLYLKTETEMLSIINFNFIKQICEILKIKTKLSWSSDFILTGDKTERLINLCKQLGATTYYTGPAAKKYIDEDNFEKNSIELVYYDYSGYPTYKQLWEGFEHKVTVLDLIFNEGSNAFKFMKSFKTMVN